MSETTAVTKAPTSKDPSAERVEQFKDGQAIGVDVSQIERELAALWRQASQGDRAVTRACSWNFVVYAGDDEGLERTRKLMDETVAAVPSRTILLKPRLHATGTEIEAYISANCQLAPDGGKMLCTEEITIESRGKGGEHIPSLLRALLVPDVPTALWWSGVPPTDANVARPYLGGVDRLLVDTRNIKSETGLAKLSHVDQLTEALQLADLNWLRLGSVRSALAALFDPPTGPDALFRLKRVKLEATERGLPAAKLLLGWLASRLSWGAPERLAERGKNGWQIPRNQGQLRADVDIVPSTSRESGFRSIVLESDTGERVSLRDAGAGQLEAQSHSTTRTFSTPEHSEAELLVAALGSRGRDKLFGTALHRAAELER